MAGSTEPAFISLPTVSSRNKRRSPPPDVGRMRGRVPPTFRELQSNHQLNTGMRYSEIVAEDATRPASKTPAVRAAEAARKRSDAAKSYQDTLAAARDKNAAASRTRARAARTYQSAMNAAH